MYEQSESAICINSTSEKQQKSENNLWDDYEPSKNVQIKYITETACYLSCCVVLQA